LFQTVRVVLPSANDLQKESTDSGKYARIEKGQKEVRASNAGDERVFGKTVLVTGAAKRVGRAIARELHSVGANVALHYRDAAEEAVALVSEMNTLRPDSAVGVRADLLEIASLTEIVEKTVQRFGGLDALVNNASSFFSTPLGSIGLTEWEDLIGSNLRAPLFLTQVAAPYLKASGGAVVNITDIHAERPLAGYPLYSIAKAGLLGLTRAFAVELAPDVRVNAVAPGPVLWPDDELFDATAREAIVAATLLKRTGRPSDIASAVRFFLHDAPYVTGQVISVDGGRSVRA
jgi:pteridine reductase